MKKLILILAIFLLPLSLTVAQEPSVKISNAERLVDKYIDKAGAIVDSTFAIVAPMAEKAFDAYTAGYKARGTIGMYTIGIVFFIAIFLILLSIFIWIWDNKLRKAHGSYRSDFLEDASTGVLFVIGTTIAILTLIVGAICIGDLYTMMKAPEYWVIKDILGKI